MENQQPIKQKDLRADFEYLQSKTIVFMGRLLCEAERAIEGLLQSAESSEGTLKKGLEVEAKEAAEELSVLKECASWIVNMKSEQQAKRSLLSNVEESLSFFQLQVAESRGFYSWNAMCAEYTQEGIYKMEIIAEENFALYIAQQAKHSGFIAGCEAQKPLCAEAATVKQETEYINCSTGYAIVSRVDVDSILNCDNAQSPYEKEVDHGA